MSPSSQLTAATANGGGLRPEKQELEANLAVLEQLMSRIAALEDLAAQRHSSGSHEIAEEENEEQQQQQRWDEGSGERQTSSHGVGGGGGGGGGGGAGEDTAVGARMTVAASSSSDIRAAGHKRGDGGEVTTGSGTAKRPKLDDDDNPVSEGSLSRRLGGGTTGGGGSGNGHDAVDNGSNHTMSTLHSSEEAMSQRRDDDYELHRDAWDRALRVLGDLRTYSKDAWVFCQPVQTLWPDLVDYTKVIDKPMDLGTVKTRIESKFYSSTKAFAVDVRLTFDNAIRFNAAGSIYHKLAIKMRQKFDTAYKTVERLYNKPPKSAAAKSKMRPLMEVAPPPPPPPLAVAVAVSPPRLTEQIVAPVVEVIDAKQMEQVATPVSYRVRDVEFSTPKTKKVRVGINPRLGRQANSLAYGGCRTLNAKEKAKLSELVDSFPEDRMRKVVEIVGEKYPDLVLTPEVELDLDKLDKFTLFSLYRLGMNWQKSKNKVLAKSKSFPADDSLSDGGQQRAMMDNSDNNIDIVGLDSPDRDNGVEVETEVKDAGQGGQGEKESSSDSDSESGTSSSDSESSDSDSEIDSEGEAEGGSDKDKG